MIRSYNVVRASARRVQGAIDRVTADYKKGEVQIETDFTSKMLQAIKDDMNGFHTHDIAWRGMVLNPSTQENQYGADFLGVLSVNLDEFQVNKGFLAQAKRIQNDRSVDMKTLKGQCKRMLRYTPDSFVFLYKETGVRIVPAIGVVSLNSHNLSVTELYSRSPQSFFEEHFECFVGDRKISTPTADALAELQGKFDRTMAIYLTAQKV